MVNVDAQSNLIWSALGVLQEACHNPEARNALIHTYKFGPVLTRLLSVQFTSEKRLRILNLLQDLTYGIRISWQEAHLPQLISMLTKWITGDDAELIPVSVGILVNLCYKNLPAVYTLMRAVDIKKFLKIILKLQKNNDHLRVQICKLLIILECVSGGVPDSEINTYVRTTCPTLIEGLRNRNASLMRHVVDFYKEILDNAKVSHILTSYPSYLTDLGGIIEILQSEESTMNTDCLVIIFDFFICVIGLAKTDLEPLFPQLLNFTLRWVRTDGVSTTALNLLTTIITQLSTLHLQTNSNNTADSVFEILDKQLDVSLQNSSQIFNNFIQLLLSLK
ncbi:hypothetical protein AAG570_011807 [Ranatra chinensis]|uniref:CIP2A N-terminal domain-containing protein n=1 Tax=Ranatra chinensis TaxID=642074 RepID=A0ABD0YGY9_9HEMI